jgi:hypothetical protein
LAEHAGAAIYVEEVSMLPSRPVPSCRRHTRRFRQAEAHHAKVALRVSDQSWFVNVQDNGNLMSSAHAIGKAGTHGLPCMRERAVMRGGHRVMDVGDLGSGRVTVCLPPFSPASVLAGDLANQTDASGAVSLANREVPHD